MQLHRPTTIHRSRLLSTALLLATTTTAQTGLVSPADRALLEGNSSTIYPLGRFDARLQELHSDFGAAALTINGHAYRRDAIATRGQVAGFQVEMSVSLSMSPLTPDSASRTFANNAGANPTVVLPRTWVSFPATNRPALSPASTFEFRVPYATPFAYPAGGGTLCIDTSVYGNNGPNGANANFTSYQDAHEQFDDGHTAEPGFRYGQGCPGAASLTPAWAAFELRDLSTGMEFDVDARNGQPSDQFGSGVSALVFGAQSTVVPWRAAPGCDFLTNNVASYLLPGPNDPSGNWAGMITGFTLPVGTRFYVQVASAHPVHGLALSDASYLEVPPPGPMPITSVRIAAGSDHTATTGTVSQVAPVIEVF